LVLNFFQLFSGGAHFGYLDLYGQYMTALVNYLCTTVSCIVWVVHCVWMCSQTNIAFPRLSWPIFEQTQSYDVHMHVESG